MAPEDSTRPRLSVVVPSSQGCHHAQAVLESLRAQLGEGDRLIVAEPTECQPSGLPHFESHVPVGDLSDEEVHLWAMDAASGDIVIQLEDHGVPDPGFIDGIVDLFHAHPSLQAQTFWMRNGTPESIGSRVLFAYVAGLAENCQSRSTPKPVSSSFALRKAYFQQARAAGVVQRPGDLEYAVIPPLANVGIGALPPAICVTHYQQNSIAEALSAIHWNARAAGAMESSRSLPARPRVMARRYLGHVVRLQQARRRPPVEQSLLVACGAAGMAGWWIGRLAGPRAAADRLKAAHPVPAGADSARSARALDG